MARAGECHRAGNGTDMATIYDSPGSNAQLCLR